MNVSYRVSLLALLTACVETPMACPTAYYVPLGPTVEDPCACDGTAMKCNGTTCDGAEDGAYYCEVPADVSNFANDACLGCKISFLECAVAFTCNTG